MPVRELATQIRQSVRKWEWITFGQPASTARAALPLVALRLDGVEDPAERAGIAKTFAEIYRRHDLALVLEERLGAATPIWTLVASRPPAGGTVASAGAPARVLPAMASAPAAALDGGATRSDAVAIDGPAALSVAIGFREDAGAGQGPAAVGNGTQPAPAQASGKGWALMAVRPDGSIEALSSYESSPLGDDRAFGGEGDLRGAAEASARVMREFVIGNPLKSVD